VRLLRVGQSCQNNDGDVAVGGGKSMSINIDKIKSVDLTLKKGCARRRFANEESGRREQKELKCRPPHEQARWQDDNR
jgi:hypothetical protein